MIQPEVFHATLGDRLISLRHCIDQAELEFAQLSAEFATGNEWDLDGFNSPSDWIRVNCNMNSNTVWGALSVGEVSRRLGNTIESMQAGQVGYAHVVTMARTAEAVGGEFDEAQLLPLAEKHSPGKFYRKCLHYQHSVDAQGYGADQETKFEGRALRLSTAQDGCLLISGILDPVGGAAVRSALEPLAQKSGAHDDRSLEQRFADALYERVTYGQRVNLQVTATIETLKTMAGAAAGEMEFTLPIAAESVRRMACDCSVTRVLLSQESVVMDVGRSKRLVNGGLRHALDVRDEHCRWPNCERSASYCDGHHLVHWSEGGATDLDNVVLLCKRHHRLVHEGGWQLIKADEGQIAAVAPTITFGLPRGPD